VNLWEKLWGGMEVLVGHPEHSVTWQGLRYDELEPPRPPPVDLGCLVLTEGGFSLLLFRWLVLVDPWEEEAHYQPLIWLEFVPEGSDVRHLALRLTVPPDRGRLSLRLPLSLGALRKLGPLGVSWESWRDEDRRSLDDGTTPPEGL